MGDMNELVNYDPMLYVTAFSRGAGEVDRRHIGDRNYSELNPVFTDEVCRALSKRNCRHCHTTGVQHFSKPHLLKWSEACGCVKRKIAKMDKNDRDQILMGKFSEDEDGGE